MIYLSVEPLPISHGVHSNENFCLLVFYLSLDLYLMLIGLFCLSVVVLMRMMISTIYRYCSILPDINILLENEV